MNVVIQPYFYWGKGHYKAYSSSLVGEGDVLITSSLVPTNNAIFQYYFLRVLCMVVCMCKLSLLVFRKGRVKTIFINETEPLALLLFSPIILISSTKVVLTLHAVTKFSRNRLDGLLVSFQRILLGLFLKLFGYFKRFKVVVHSKVHRNAAIKKYGIPSLKISVIEYPCPSPNQQPLSGKGLLIFGAIRDDKHMGGFIQDLINIGYNGYHINIVGKITDPNVAKYANNAPSFIKFFDKHVTDAELEHFVSLSKYFIVPYGMNYSGGAGPIKDAASFGRPALATTLEIFRDLSLLPDSYCMTFENAKGLYDLINSIDEDKYAQLSKNAIKFSESNSWLNFREKYLLV